MIILPTDIHSSSK